MATSCELTVNALAALVRRGWTVTMDADGIYYSLNGMNYPGDWLTIPGEVAEALGSGV